MRNMLVNVAVKPPTLTKPEAEPKLEAGFAVRAKSNPMVDPTPQAPISTRSTTTAQNGGEPGQTRNATYPTSMMAASSSTTFDRRNGNRAVTIPMSGPATMPATTMTGSSADAVSGSMPSPVTSNG